MAVWMSGWRRRPAGADHRLRLGQVAAGAAKRRVVTRHARSAGLEDEQRRKAAGHVAERLKPAAHRKQVVHCSVVDLRRRRPRGVGDRVAAERDGLVQEADARLPLRLRGRHAQCAQQLASLVCEGRSITGF